MSTSETTSTSDNTIQDNPKKRKNTDDGERRILKSPNWAKGLTAWSDTASTKKDEQDTFYSSTTTVSDRILNSMKGQPPDIVARIVSSYVSSNPKGVPLLWTSDGTRHYFPNIGPSHWMILQASLDEMTWLSLFDIRSSRIQFVGIHSSSACVHPLEICSGWDGHSVTISIGQHADVFVPDVDLLRTEINHHLPQAITNIILAYYPDFHFFVWEFEQGLKDNTFHPLFICYRCYMRNAS